MVEFTPRMQRLVENQPKRLVDMIHEATTANRYMQKEHAANELAGHR